MNRNIPVRSEQELAQLPQLADHFEVGEHSEALITRMRIPVDLGSEPSGELLVGDILRRTCKLGGDLCAKAGCQAPENFKNTQRECSDLNLGGAFIELGLQPEKVLMIGVTADKAGFYDQISEYGATTNSLGFSELPGYNAFFARANEEVVLGARLADCGFVAVEMIDREGVPVHGFMHMTRPNMQGEDSLKFEVDGRPAGSFEYFLDQAMKHYGADKSSVRAHVLAAIKSENFVHTFKDEDGSRLEERFPGWFNSGLMENASNPGWKQGDPLDQSDKWYPKYREMIDWQLRRAGLTEEQISFEGCIDPGDLELGHASNHHGAKGKIPDARDAYLLMPKKA